MRANTLTRVSNNPGAVHRRFIIRARSRSTWACVCSFMASGLPERSGFSVSGLYVPAREPKVLSTCFKYAILSSLRRLITGYTTVAWKTTAITSTDKMARKGAERHQARLLPPVEAVRRLLPDKPWAGSR